MIDPRDAQPRTLRPLRRTEFDRLVALGTFENERVELIEGTLVTMSPQGAAHAEIVMRLTERLLPALVGRARVLVQSPLALGDESEPEPDVAIVPVEDYSRQHPTRALLVIEVADASLRADRILKGRLYARHLIPEYWIVNLPDRVVEVYRDPKGDAYAARAVHAAGAVVSPAPFADVVVDVGQLLP